jgi:hypothetical protein
MRRLYRVLALRICVQEVQKFKTYLDKWSLIMVNSNV